MKEQTDYIYDDSDLSEEEWLRWAVYLMFLDDDEEDLYTLEDGQPYVPSSES